MATLRYLMWRHLPLFVIVVFFTRSSIANFKVPTPWAWSCINETCLKQENFGSDPSVMSLSTCKLTCSRDGVLWPKPTGITHLENKTVHFHLEDLTLQEVEAPSKEVRELVEKSFVIFKENVARKVPPNIEGKNSDVGPQMPEVKNRTISVRIDISASGTATRLALETNEAYALNVRSFDDEHINVTILSSTFFGSRHALETLSQLMEYDDTHGALEIVSSAAVSDSPKFKYRGILLDTSRNFFSVKAIERTLDAMAANKLNTFHWHITDSHSFPLSLETLPEMVYYGAYSPQQVYKTTDIQNLVEYGRVRGIRVLPEFAAPARVGNGWQFARKKGMGEVAVCLNQSLQEPWSSYCDEPPCGQLNVVNENTYIVLGQIYKEMADIFGPLDLFHFGGDEINLNCWNTTEEIVTYMEKREMDRSAESFFKLWNDFQAKAYGLMVTANQGKQIPGILWSSNLTQEGPSGMQLDPEHYIIQIGTAAYNTHIRSLLEKGFHVIFSNYDAWRLDCGFSTGNKKGDSQCGLYSGWQAVYDNSPTQIALNLTGSSHGSLILGGEATLWSAQVDGHSLDAKLWPRGAALAERLWSNPSHNWKPAETRFIHNRQRLVQRGIQADRIQPQWCHQNEGLCYL